VDKDEDLRPSPFAYFNSSPDFDTLTSLMKKEMAQRPPKQAPKDGWFVYPVDPTLPLELWSRKTSRTTRHLEAWGLRYWVIRAPEDTIGKRVQCHILARIQEVLDGDGLTHSGIESFTDNGKRSSYPAKHLGLSNHYGGDGIGPKKLRLFSDTDCQTNSDEIGNPEGEGIKKAKTDAIKRLLGAIHQYLAPLITRYLRYLDPDVYQFHLMCAEFS
jgi:hypothetical protein